MLSEIDTSIPKISSGDDYCTFCEAHKNCRARNLQVRGQWFQRDGARRPRLTFWIVWGQNNSLRNRIRVPILIIHLI